MGLSMLFTGGRILRLVIFTILVLNFGNAVVSAHSGRTDSNGGHNCNVGSCAGTYHYHNGGSSYTPPPQPNYYLQGRTNGTAHADREADNISLRSKGQGYKVGLAMGKAGEVKRLYHTVPASVCDTNFTFDAGTDSTYISSYNSGWKTQCGVIADVAYKTAYAEGYTLGVAQREAVVVKSAANKDTPKSTSVSNDYTGWLIPLAIVFIYGVSYIWDYLKNH